jgi:hypothetical protein
MTDEPYYSLAHLDDTEVGVQPTLDGQDILIQHSDLGQRLACLLACGNTEIARQGELLFWRVHHSPEVDRLLVELTDLFISIRYVHPTLVQLELDLDACARAAGASEPAP